MHEFHIMPSRSDIICIHVLHFIDFMYRVNLKIQTTRLMSWVRTSELTCKLTINSMSYLTDRELVEAAVMIEEVIIWPPVAEPKRHAWPYHVCSL